MQHINARCANLRFIMDGEPLCDDHQLFERRFWRSVNIGYVLFGDDQGVTINFGGFWQKADHIFSLINYVGGELLMDNPAKNALAHVFFTGFKTCCSLPFSSY